MLTNLYRRKYQFFAGFTVLYLILACFAIELTVKLFTDYHTNTIKDDIRGHVAIARSNLEATMYHDVYVADSLSTLVTLAPEFAIEHWDLIAGRIVAKASSVRNIVLAPNDVMSYVFPLDGNEKVIGVDYRAVPEQYEKVKIAREKKEMVLDGPLQLVQGGTGLIARYPIFSDSPHNKEYWGVISVVLDYDKLLQQAGIFSLDGANLAIEKVSSTNNELIYGDPAVVEQAEMDFPIHLPNGDWVLYASYQDEQMNQDTPEIVTLARISGTIAFILGYILIFLLFRSYLELYKTSIQDELTGIPNRRYILSQLDRIAAKSNDNLRFALLSIDMDEFKSVNDAYGHEAGDALLKHVTKQLNECLRISDTICRFGGDEFIVLLHRVSSEDDVQQIIAKLHERLNSHPLAWSGLQIVPSVSIGYALHKGQLNTVKIRELFARADKKMYEQKNVR